MSPSSVPDVIRRPGLARVTVAPTAVALGAAGAGIGALDHSVVVAVLLAAVGYGSRAGWLGWRRLRLRPRRSASLPAVDPWSVPVPWRPLLADAVDAQRRFTQVVDQLPAGPTRDRVTPMVRRIDASVRAAQAAAQRSAVLASPARTSRADALSRELAALQQRAGPRGDPHGDAHEAALAAQLRALRRAESVSAAGLDQLRLLTARLDDAVTGLVELGAARPGDPSAGGRGPGSPLNGPLGPAPGSLAAVLDELDALHSGLEQTRLQLEAAAAPPASPAP